MYICRCMYIAEFPGVLVPLASLTYTFPNLFRTLSGLFDQLGSFLPM